MRLDQRWNMDIPVPGLSLGVFVFLCLIPLLLISCSNKEKFPDQDWSRGTPSSQGLDQAGMEVALEYLEAQCGQNGLDQAMIIRNGVVIFAGDSIGKPNNIYSSTKSITSTIFGLLVEDGVLEVETKASAIDPGLKGLYPEVTLKHFTTMTSGYSAVGTSRWNEDSEDWALDPFEIDTPLFSPGTAYAYWDEAQMMFGRLLTIAANKSLQQLFAERIATPIGLGPFEWWSEWDYQGNAINNGCTGLELSASQLARFGLLFLNNGRWNDRQLVPETWVRKATTNQVDASIPIADTDRKSTKGSGNYGFNWWTNGEVEPGVRALPDAPAGLYYASGFNNNMLFVIPEWNMIVVRTGLDGNPKPTKKIVYNEFFKLLSKAVID